MREVEERWGVVTPEAPPPPPVVAVPVVVPAVALRAPGGAAGCRARGVTWKTRRVQPAVRGWEGCAEERVETKTRRESDFHVIIQYLLL